MSAETSQWLNTNTLIGYTEKRGNAWHYRAEDQGEESNHYPGPIPVEDVVRRLFSWKAIEVSIVGEAESVDGVVRYEDPTRKGIVRSDTGQMLGIFKQSYHAHDPQEWLIHKVEQMLGGDIAIGNAGLLKGGAQHFVQVEAEDTVKVVGLEFRPFWTAMGSMDGSLASTYQDGCQIVVCDNTMASALAETDVNRIKVYHGSGAQAAFERQVSSVDVLAKIREAATQKFTTLAAQKVTTFQFKKFAQLWAEYDPKAEKPGKQGERRFEELTKLWMDDPRVTPWKGTALGVLQAANTFEHHLRAVEGATRETRNLQRMLTGKVEVLDAKALRLLASVV
jgi:phage/plasmid-like protein (TIGR03299 family)